MIEWRQKILGKGQDAIDAGEEPGDCLRAAVACILEKPIERVPNFVHTGVDPQGLWRLALVGWLHAEGVDLYRSSVAPPHPVALGRPWSSLGWCILGGMGPRGHRHIVVGWQGVAYWDPHPSDAGLVTVEEFYRFEARYEGEAARALETHPERLFVELPPGLRATPTGGRT